MTNQNSAMIDHWEYAQKVLFISQILEHEGFTDMSSYYKDSSKSILNHGKSCYKNMPNLMDINVLEFFDFMIPRAFYLANGNYVRSDTGLNDFIFFESVATPFGEEFPV